MSRRGPRCGAGDVDELASSTGRRRLAVGIRDLTYQHDDCMTDVQFCRCSPADASPIELEGDVDVVVALEVPGVEALDELALEVVADLRVGE